MSTSDNTRYRLRVSVGPSADPKDLKPIAPNDDAHPLWIESDEFVGQVVVRIKGLDKTFGYKEGAQQDNIKAMPDSPWFHKPGADSNLSSIQIQGGFKRAWTGDQIVFGNQFEQPLRLPPFSSIALKFVQFIDPGLEADIYSDKPWAFSPLIATMNTVNVSEWKADSAAHIDEGVQDHNRGELPQWPSSEGDHILEDTSLLFKSKEKSGTTTKDNGKEVLDLAHTEPVSMNTAKRRSYFSQVANLEKHTYEPDHVYSFDFFNPYLDFSSFTLKIPGFSVDITRYWDGQPLTYIVKSKDNSVVFLAVQFELVPVTDVAIQ
ncbi:hypothetical protein BGZ74_006804 [Mortierella antarctica]|nr:hypothetical protein BGZ74_006804 [Mortierella antarctica]